MSDLEIVRLMEINREMHAQINKLTARLTKVEKLLGTPTESFNDLSCKVGDLKRRVIQLEEYNEQ